MEPQLNTHQKKIIKDIMRSILQDDFDYLSNDVAIFFDLEGEPEIHIN